MKLRPVNRNDYDKLVHTIMRHLIMHTKELRCPREKRRDQCSARALRKLGYIL